MIPAPRPSLSGLFGADQKRPLYSRLPGLYFATPPGVKSMMRWLLGARRGGSEALIRQYLGRLDQVPTGEGRPVPMLFTHDVDTAEGYANLPRLLRVEESLGLASLTFLVTHRYGWDAALLASFQERGHRFGVHDTTHDNRLAYLPIAEIRDRVRRAKEALGPLDSGAFRAPAFLRSAALYEGICDLVRLDFSSNDWALLWPHPGDGVGTPFPLRYRRAVCVPTTLPRDGEMLALGLDAAGRLDLLKRKATELWRVDAPAVLLTHPDPTFTDSEARIAAYADFLRWARDSGAFQLLPPAECLKELEGRARIEFDGQDKDHVAGLA